MSKKDELDMDLDDFGADDFDEPPRSSDRSRNPVLETASVARKSALKALWGRGQRTKVILDAMPDGTVVYAALPNLSGTVADFYEALAPRLASNPVLASWWSEGPGAAG